MCGVPGVTGAHAPSHVEAQVGVGWTSSGIHCELQNFGVMGLKTHIPSLNRKSTVSKFC